MAVVPLTLAISLLLVATFIVFFLREHSRGATSSPERDSLLPLEEETPRQHGNTKPLSTNEKATGDSRQGTAP
jgi:hypothetical protein